MLKTAVINRPFISLVLAALLGAGSCPAVFAQAYSGQISFLEEYASRLYDRGDYADAWKEFERIARLDPRNAPAAKYLKLIAEKTGQKPANTRSNLDHIDSAIRDLTALREDITRHETDARDLEYLIRNLITENDALYSMLYLRSRELGELRAKFSGTPYAGAFDALMKSLPPDRVPQHLHQSNEFLDLIREQSTGISVNAPGTATPETPAPIAPDAAQPAAAAAAAADEVQSLVQSITANKKIPDSAQKVQKLTAAIDDQRSILVDKTLAMLGKQNNLAALKTNLTEMNATLKTIDAYYQAIKSELASKNFTEQKQFADLMVDYTAKLKEIDILKTRVENADQSLGSVKDNLIKQTSAIAELNAALASRDREIAEFKSQLAEKAAVIEKQQADLSFTDGALGQAGARLTSIENLLKENDADLAILQAGISKMRSLVQAKKGEPPLTNTLPDNTAAARPPESIPAPQVIPAVDASTALNNLLAQKDRQLSLLRTDSAGISTRLTEAQTRAADAAMVNAALKDENALLTDANNERTSFCNTLNARLAELSGRTRDKNETLLAQKEAVSSLTARMQKLEDQLMDTRADLSDKNRALRKAQSQTRSLEAALAKSDSTAQRSKNALLEQEETAQAKTDAIARLKTEIETLMSENGETPILHETLAKKDNAIVLLKQQIFELTAAARDRRTTEDLESKTAVRNYSLDLQEKTAQIKALQGQVDEKTRIIKDADDESLLLQEKLSVMKAKQDAIRGVVQKRDMEFMRASAEAEAKAKDLAQTTAEREALKKQLADKESAAALAESRLQQREEEIARLDKEIASLQTTASNAHEEIARLNIELKKWRK